MDESAKKTYRLYALPPTWESIGKAVGMQYSRVTPTPAPGYVLIYTDGEEPENAEEITEKNADLLSDADKTWLMECVASILAEEARKRQPEIIRSLSERIEALEEALKKSMEDEREKEGEGWLTK